MQSAAPEVKLYVRELVLNYLSSPRVTKQLEDAYRRIPHGVKMTATERLNRTADRLTELLLDGCKSVDDLSRINKAFLRRALLQALKE